MFYILRDVVGFYIFLQINLQFCEFLTALLDVIVTIEEGKSDLFNNKTLKCMINTFKQWF